MLALVFTVDVGGEQVELVVVAQRGFDRQSHTDGAACYATVEVPQVDLANLACSSFRGVRLERLDDECPPWFGRSPVTHGYGWCVLFPGHHLEADGPGTESDHRRRGKQHDDAGYREQRDDPMGALRTRPRSRNGDSHEVCCPS